MGNCLRIQYTKNYLNWLSFTELFKIQKGGGTFSLEKQCISKKQSQNGNEKPT